MNTKDDGGPAFPVHEYRNRNGDTVQYPSEGMMLLDYFAANATEEDIRAVMKFGESMSDPRDRAEARYRHADAMLKAREA